MHGVAYPAPSAPPVALPPLASLMQDLENVEHELESLHASARELEGRLVGTAIAKAETGPVARAPVPEAPGEPMLFRARRYLEGCTVELTGLRGVLERLHSAL